MKVPLLVTYVAQSFTDTLHRERRILNRIIGSAHDAAGDGS